MEGHYSDDERDLEKSLLLSISDLLSPLLMELGIGGLGGFLMGYYLKKVAKLIVMIVGFIYLGMYYLVSTQIIAIDFSALGRSLPGMQGQAMGIQFGFASLVEHAPLGAAFLGGLYLGIQNG